MNRKVLILGPSFFGYNQSICRAFTQLDYQAEVLEYDEPIHPFNLKNKILHKVFSSCKYLQEESCIAFNEIAIAKFEDFEPGLVFIYNGDILKKETIRHFKARNAKVAIWMLDGLNLHPNSIAIAAETDAYFCFEKSDVAKLKAMGVNAHFLSQAYDPEVYYPISSPKDIDILFVGTLYNYPKRILLLKRLAESLGNKYKIKIYGRYKPIFKEPLKWLFREKRNIFMNNNIPPEKVNRLYNRAKICINIHHEQTKEGANPKVFEISGAGAFQLVDYNTYIASIYPGGEVLMYHSEEDFINKIQSVIDTDTTILAEKAHKTVLYHHTFKHRLQEVLYTLEL